MGQNGNALRFSSQKGTQQMIATLIFIALLPIGLYVYARLTAVEGWEDADGFHRGKQEK